MSKQVAVRAVLVMALTLSAAACGDDESTACDEVDALEESVEVLFSDDTRSGGRDAVEDSLERVGDDLRALRDAADDEIGAELGELGDRLRDVGTAVEGVDPSDLRGGLDDVTDELGEVGDAWSSLVDAVRASVDECRVDDSLE